MLTIILNGAAFEKPEITVHKSPTAMRASPACRNLFEDMTVEVKKQAIANKNHPVFS